MTQSEEHDTIEIRIEAEESLDIPLDRINPLLLRKMIEEFVTREWSESADSPFTLEENVDQVLQQLKSGRARVVFDVSSETWNIVSCC
jgi:uncharacterized protein